MLSPTCRQPGSIAPSTFETRITLPIQGSNVHHSLRKWKHMRSEGPIAFFINFIQLRINGYGIRRLGWFGKPPRIPVSPPYTCFPLHFYGRILSFDSESKHGHRWNPCHLFSWLTRTQRRSGSQAYLRRLGTRTSRRTDYFDHIETYSPLWYTLGISSSQCTDVRIRNNRHGLPSITFKCSALLRLFSIFKFPINCC